MTKPADELAAALKTLARLGVNLVWTNSAGALSVIMAARRLDVSADWVKAHLDEFPNWYRLPAGQGASGQNVGEIRIPMRDLDAFEARQKKLRGAHE